MSIIQNLTQRTPAVKVDGRIVNQNAAKPQESLRSLESGDRLSGKIISMTDEGGIKNAQIRLGDNSVISAKLQDGMYLKEGQTISFEVRGVSNQITLTPLYENTSIDPTTLKALIAAGLEVNQDTVNMVRSMMENGLGIDKNSLTSMHQLITSHTDADISSVVQMRALDIPVTEQNLQQFESYKNYEHQVVETMKSIMDDLPEAYDQLVQNGEGQAANDLYGGILDMLAKGAEHMEQSFIQNEPETISAQNEQGLSGMQNENTLPGMQNEVNVPSMQNGTEVPVFQTEIARLQTQNDSAGVLPAGEIPTGNEETTVLNENGEKVNVGEEPLETLMPGKETADENIDAVTTESRKGINTNQAEISDASGENIRTHNGNQFVSQKMTFSNELAGIIRELSTGTGATGTEIQKLIAQAGSGKTAEIDQMALLKELADAYAKSAHTSERADQAFTKLFGNNEYNKLMKNIMQDEWMLRPDDVGVKENVENLYARLNSQARQLTQQLTTAFGADSKVAQSAANLQNNIDFMNQLNQMFHYVQLPLKMADQNAHGDLYVYSNGKRKFEPGDTVSAILHLDMDNLGPLDVYVKMRDNNVKTNFYVADESVIDLIAEHIGELSDRLNKRGYNMEAKMMLHTDMDDDSEDPPVSSILDAKKTSFMSMTSFDARA
ncbi:flagellar hook-length control protein FliK [Butyrivibrio sp. AE3004]|uniref:flagellar hook-length control protein FliK n=1 Tax=Butyrivibrio sp. AE3004 TaxID=1506994 RepID=UPI000493F352|nr:flagellar hook-length control protein FliK [Butyrivibrio sp. AE3004]